MRILGRGARSRSAGSRPSRHCLELLTQACFDVRCAASFVLVYLWIPTGTVTRASISSSTWKTAGSADRALALARRHAEMLDARRARRRREARSRRATPTCTCCYERTSRAVSLSTATSSPVRCRVRPPVFKYYARDPLHATTRHRTTAPRLNIWPIRYTILK